MTQTLFSSTPALALASEKERAGEIAEAYTEEEARRYASELLDLGDQLVDEKKYNYALAAYEEVFLFDPDNAKASARIDRLKKQSAREGKDESGIVKGVYEEQINERARKYWLEAREYLKNKKYGQARFAVEKILLLDPENKEAQTLYDELKRMGGAM